MESVTVKGQQFEVNNPYQEGHECSAGEAKTLWRDLKKIYDVWLRKRMKNGAAGDELQAELDVFASNYKLGQRVGLGPRKLDPVARKAFELAQHDVREKLKRAGARLSGPNGVKTGLINRRAREWVADADRGYLQLAAKELKKTKPAQAIDEDIADLLGF